MKGKVRARSGEPTMRSEAVRLQESFSHFLSASHAFTPSVYSIAIRLHVLAVVYLVFAELSTKPIEYE